MSPFRAIARGVRALFNRRRTEQEMADELRHYVEELALAHRRRGVAPDDALRAARFEVGNLTSVKEQVRGSGWENHMETLTTDIRYAARRLRAAPGFTAVVLLTLALGIGVATAIFSAVKPILLEALPYPGADRVMAIWEGAPDGRRNAGTYGMYRELERRTRSFEAIAVVRAWQPTVTGGDRPERLEGQRVTADYFRVLGIAPAIGRNFERADDRLGGPAVVILDDAFWRSRFGGDPGIIGREIMLDDRRYTVIGVMPPTFENVLAPSARLWTALQYDVTQPRAWGHHLATIARLAPGATVDAASRELRSAGRAVLAEMRPETYADDAELRLTPLRDDLARTIRPALLAVAGAALIVLAIVGVNVTNLLLARGVRRQGELALRTALGASRGRIVRQLLTEIVFLALLGGALGMFMAFAGVRALAAMSPPGLPRVAAMEIDGVAFGFGFGVSVMIALVAGVLPVSRSSRGDPRTALQASSTRVAGGRARMRSTLVVAEVALAAVLLVGSGLLLKSLDRLFAVDAGFDARNLLTVQVQTSGERFANDTASDLYFASVLDAVRRIPGVHGAGLTSQLPLSGDRDEYGVRLYGQTAANSSFRYSVSPGYFEAMSIPVRRGRTLDERDHRSSTMVAVINESFARRLFAGGDPIGQRIHVGGDTGVYTIVGVVGDVKQASLAVDQSDAVYTTLEQWGAPERLASVVVRGRSDVTALLPGVREAIWSVDRDQPIVRLATMDDLIAATAAERTFLLRLFAAFALAALILAAAGLYGILAGSVAERMREIGVRSALGATSSDIVGLVVRQGMVLTGIGVVLGIIGATVATRAIAAMLFGVSATDPTTYAAVILLLSVTALLASAVPASRAARVDPATTLRVE